MVTETDEIPCGEERVVPTNKGQYPESITWKLYCPADKFEIVNC